MVRLLLAVGNESSVKCLFPGRNQITGRDYTKAAGFAYLNTMCINPAYTQVVLKFFWASGGSGTASSQVLLATMGKILAHEIAHVLGVHHDGEGNGCNGRIAAHRLMTPVISQDARLWSDCSKGYVDKFLKSKRDTCLYH